MFKFEDKIAEIDSAIERKRSSWRLTSISWLDFDDVKQMIRLHIFKKWSQWEQDKPIEPWLCRIVSNQVKNMLRDYYYVHARPCLRCAANTGGDSCSLYNTQCKACPIYKKWEKSKSAKHEGNIARSIYSDESCEPFIKSMCEESNIDYFKVIKLLSKKIKKEMSKEAYYVFLMMYVEHLDEEVVAKKRGYSRDPKSTTPRYRQLENFKKKYKDKLKELLNEGGII